MKILLLIIFIFLVAGTSIIAANKDGLVVVECLNYHIEISSVFLFSSLIILLILFFKFSQFILFLLNIPASLQKYFATEQEKNDLKLLIDGFVATSLNNVDSMKKLVRKISESRNHPKFKENQDLIDLVLTQLYLSLTKFDQEYLNKLEESYQKLLNSKNYKFFGLIGIVTLRVEQKRYYDALHYAEQAYELNSKSAEIIKHLIKIYSSLESFDKQEKMIQRAYKLDFLSSSETDQALLKCYLNIALQAINDSEVRRAKNYLEKALKIDSSFSEAVFALARLYSQEDNKKAAYKIIEKAWQKEPSRELAKFALDLYSDLKLAKQVKMLDNLIDILPETKDAYIVLSELYIENNLLEEARKVMEKLLSLHAPDSRMSRIMAVIEARENRNIASVTNWLDKML